MTFLLAAARSAIPLLRYKLHSRRHPTDVAGLESLENRFLPILRSTHTRRVNTVLAIAGVPRAALPAFLRTTAEEFHREAIDYRPNPASTSALLNEHLNCFVGDSHAEFYSRAFAADRSTRLWDPVSFWLGSKTLLGFVSSAARHLLMVRLRQELLPFLEANSSGRKSMAICWTLGSIDVRSSFRELMVRNSNDDVNEVLAIFERTLISFMEDVVLPFQEQVAERCGSATVRSFFVSAIGPTTEEIEVRTIKEIVAARKRYPDPTFGSLAERRVWTSAVNAVIERACSRNGINYYNSRIWVTEEDSEKSNSRDNVHLTNPSSILKMNEEIAVISNAAR